MSPFPLGILASAHVAASGWTPADIATLVGWWDASDAGTITSSGGLVSQWADKSGVGNHLLQASDPAKPTTGSHTQGGLNVLRFGGNDELICASSVLTTSTTHTVGIVTTPSDTSNSYLVSLATSGGQQSCLISKYAASFEHYEARYQIGGYSDTGAHVIAYTRSAGSYAGAYDGTASGSQSGDALARTWNFTVGSAGGAAYATASIAEIILASTALDSTDLASLAAYLKAKWGTP